MKKNLGFTLIELIVVIVILGIIAVSAAPKFLDLKGDATVSSLQGMEAALTSSTNLVYSKAVIAQQLQAATNNLAVEPTVDIEIYAGFPTAHWGRSVRYLIGLDNQSFSGLNAVCQLEWCGVGNSNNMNLDDPITITGRGAKVYPRGYTFQQRCGVHYINNLDGNPPIIGISTSDC